MPDKELVLEVLRQIEEAAGIAMPRLACGQPGKTACEGGTEKKKF